MSPQRGGRCRCLAAVPLLALALAACVSGRQSSPAGAAAAPMAWTGRVSVKGNEPHTWIALTAEDGTVYELMGDKAALIRDRHQNRRLRVEGRIVSAALGPGAPARIDVTGILEVQ